MVEVFVLEIPALTAAGRFEELLALVSPEKRERIRRFRRAEDAWRTLLADVLIRSVVMERYFVANRQISFAYNAYGKPFLTLDSRFSFNVSHAGRWVCAIVGQGGPVGIDVEAIRPLDAQIARHCFSADERADLEALPDAERLAYFYDLWTLKESFVKAIGRGLSVPLDSFSVRRTRDGRFVVRQSHVPAPFFFRQYELDPAYKLSACAAIDAFADNITRRDVEDLCRRLR